MGGRNHRISGTLLLKRNVCEEELEKKKELWGGVGG